MYLVCEVELVLVQVADVGHEGQVQQDVDGVGLHRVFLLQQVFINLHRIFYIKKNE